MGGYAPLEWAPRPMPVPKMQPLRLPLTLFLCPLIALLAHGQANKTSKSDQLFAEAVGLQIEGKYGDALVKAKEAAGLEPKNARFKSYETELAGLVQKDQLHQHAIQATPEVEQTIEKLAAYLVQPAKGDEEKARLIFRWITDRIAYDADAFRSGKIPDQSALAVLKSRKAVCEGYSNLFAALGKAAGLEVVKVSGQGKGVGYAAGKKTENHAWNAVRVQGQWRLIDSTWGAGDLTAMGFNKRFKENYFLAVPGQMIFTHLPTDPKWQLQSPLVTAEQFTKWPRVPGTLFNYGVSPEAIRARLDKDPAGGVVEPLDLKQAGPRITIKAAPLERTLKVGETYRFQIEAPGFDTMLLSNGPKPVRLTSNNGVFAGEVTVQKGPLVVAGRLLNSGGTSFAGIVRYVVE